jgi:putative nucleic acid modification protein with dual OB domain
MSKGKCKVERVLIVAKTRMNNAACVSGLTINTNKSIRLLRSNGFNQQVNTPFEVGQVWELDFHPSSKIIPPHIEDVIVTRERFIGQYANLYSILIERVQPWQGEPDQLFDALLIIDKMSGYISKSRGIPKCSTGYWLPNRALNFTQKNEKPYYQIKYDMYNHYLGTLSIPYVGFANPIQYIPANTLIRVSLARWWMPSGVDDERCYLQLSGWYL